MLQRFVFSRCQLPGPSGRGGFAFLELILVVVVIALLAGWYFRDGGGGGAQQAASQYQHSMERANSTACVAGRAGLRTHILTHSMQNPGQPVTRESLIQSGVNLNVCPEQGVIDIAPDGSLTCSIHQ